MIRFEPGKNSVREIFDLVNGGVAPRPIALVSTISEEGRVNLSPFSFFNVFGANPPMVAFSASRRLRDATVKDTYRNLMATRECVVQMVTYPMVKQVSLASTEFASGVDEFIKSGLTPMDSERVRPPRVKESPFQMECVLRQMIPLGEANASGNLALCEVVAFHVAEDVWRDGRFDTDRMDLVARAGGGTYVRASGAALFEVPKPVAHRGIGWDALPESIRGSHVLTANDLAQLANSERIPDEATRGAMRETLPRLEASPAAFERAERRREVREAVALALGLSHERRLYLERAARVALESGENDWAWCALLS